MSVTLRVAGPNCNEVRIGDLTLGFSYETIVVFHHPTTGWVCSENIWSQTTGKHINMLGPGKDHPRTERGEFTSLLESITDRISTWEAHA